MVDVTRLVCGDGMRELTYGWNLEMQMRVARAAFHDRKPQPSNASFQCRGYPSQHWKVDTSH